MKMNGPDPDPLVKSMDLGIRIRVYTKMSWIRNTANKEAGQARPEKLYAPDPRRNHQ
jgi:hypothetical protein